MLFTSLIFFIFISLFLPLYFFSKGKYRILICLIASYAFYGWWDWRFLSLIILSTVIDYNVAKIIDSCESVNSRKKYLAVSLVANLSILGVFKYLNFFIESFMVLGEAVNLNFTSPIFNLILPVGISFYTFQTMSYTIDVYNKTCKVEKDCLRFSAYVALFPQLVAGPIVRAKKLLPQMEVDHDFEWPRVYKGIVMIVWGYFLKLCVADRLAFIVNPTYANPDSFGGGVHIISTIAFSFQIYGDFFGYSLIAIGLGKIMGFDFGINFNKPYQSASFSEFWERWHISLSSWLRDYLYIPLGGNRFGSFITFRNLLVVMFLGGLWHGAKWTFVLWGLLHGFYLVAQHFLSKLNLDENIKKRSSACITRLLKVFMVYSFVNFAWIFFRSDSIDDALLIVSKIISFEDYFYGIKFDLFSLVLGYSMIFLVVVVELLSNYSKVRKMYGANNYVEPGFLIILLWLILFVGVFDSSSFIYFQF